MATIKETLEVIDLGLALSGAVVASLKDGKIDSVDVPNLFPLFTVLMPAIEGIDQIPTELSDIDAVELETIKDHILAKLPSIGGEWMGFASECLKAGIAIYRTIQAYPK